MGTTWQAVQKGLAAGRCLPAFEAQPSISSGPSCRESCLCRSLGLADDILLDCTEDSRDRLCPQSPCAGSLVCLFLASLCCRAGVWGWQQGRGRFLVQQSAVACALLHVVPLMVPHVGRVEQVCCLGWFSSEDCQPVAGWLLASSCCFFVPFLWRVLCSSPTALPCPSHHAGHTNPSPATMQAHYIEEKA